MLGYNLLKAVITPRQLVEDNNPSEGVTLTHDNVCIHKDVPTPAAHTYSRLERPQDH